MGNRVWWRRNCIVSLLSLCVLCQIGCLDARVEIYKSVDVGKGFHPCFRRANGTHQFGCQTEIGGNVGVVYLVSEDEDIDWVTKDGPHNPYMGKYRYIRYISCKNYMTLYTYIIMYTSDYIFSVILTPKTFTYDNLHKLRESDRVSGVVLLSANSYPNITQVPPKYSDDQSCPNQGTSLYLNDTGISNCDAKKPWNPASQNPLHQNYPFPIVLISDNDTVYTLMDDCFKKFNTPRGKDWPLCAIEIEANMVQAVNSETCLRRNDYISVVTHPVRHCDKVIVTNLMFTKNGSVF